MAREERLAEAFVFLADTLVEGFDVLELLGGLCERCVDVLKVAAAGVLLGDTRRELRVVAASEEKMRVLEVFEAQHSEGPCYDAFVGVEQVLVPDLAAAVARWPGFVPTALASGFRAGFGFPLRLRGQCVGALNLFQTGRGALSDADVRAAQALANAVAIALLQERALREERGVREQLQGALDSRVAIEQAKGMVCAHLGIDLDEAFERLRRYSMDRNSPLHHVAGRIVAGTLDPRQLPGSV